MKSLLDVIPSALDWGKIDENPDLADAYRNFNGRSSHDAQRLFAANVLARAQDLRFMPPGPFVYYMKSFCDFVLGEKFGNSHPREVADAFLSVAKSSSENNPSALISISQDIHLALEMIENKQAEYEADPDIFGNFSERATEIRSALMRG